MFHKITAHSYWTKEPDSNNSSVAKVVCFFVGGLGYQDKRGRDYVRCVRSMD